MKHSGMLPSHCRCCSCFEQPEKRKTPCASPVRYAGGVFIPLPFPLFHRSSAETGFLTCRKALITRRKNEQTVRQIERNANKEDKTHEQSKSKRPAPPDFGQALRAGTERSDAADGRVCGEWGNRKTGVRAISRKLCGNR